MNIHPFVSVIMPVYNGEKYLPDAIRSVLNQTFSDLELIIIDDGSKDSSLAIAEQYQQQDERVVLIHQENKGVSAARNHALSYVRGQWVYFIDCDDIFYPNYIERMLEVTRLTGADYVCCDFDMGYYLNQSGQKTCAAEDIVVFENDSIRAFDYLCSQGAGTCLALKQISDKAIKKYHVSFDITMTYGEDLFFCWKTCLVSNKIAYLPEKLYFYRQTTNSAVSKLHLQLFEKYDRAYADIERFARDNGLMCGQLRKSVALSFAQRLPALLRMTMREGRGFAGSYRRVHEIIMSKRMKDAMYGFGAEIENALTGGAKKLFLQAKQKKIISMMLEGYYRNLRIKIARKIKGGS